MLEWICCLLIGITCFRNIQGKYNNSYIWRIAGIKDPLFMQLDSTGKKIIKSSKYEVFKILQDKLNFRYELAQPIPSTFGMLEKNGTWTGMAGQIALNKADMTVLPLFITYNRFHAMDFPTCVEFHQVQFILKIGGYESNWNSIIRPFRFELWIVIIIMTILTGVLLRQIIKCEPLHEIGPFRSFLRIIWYLFGTLTNQGRNLNKIYRSPSRFSVAVWLLSVVILASSYSGKLMSFMTSPIFEYVPTTFDQLASSVQNGKFSCGTFKADTISAFLMSSKTGNVRIIADHVISKNNFYNAEESIARVLKGKFAFLAGSYDLTKIQHSHGIGKLLISEDELITYSASYGIRKGFPYKEDLNKLLSRLFHSGIFNKFENQRGRVERHSASEFRPLTIEDFLSPFTLLFIGYTTSFICLIIEFILSKNLNYKFI